MKNLNELNWVDESKKYEEFLISINIFFNV